MWRNSETGCFAARSPGSVSSEDAMVKRIVVAEDDLNLGGVLKQVLTAAGYEVEVVESGEECLTLALSAEPDVIVMDVGLAGRMDGIEAATRLRRRSDCPVIFHTAHRAPERRARMESVRNSAIVQKPADIGRLVRAVERAAAARAGGCESAH
jgi:CheY-like chemotaxis protein